MPSISESSLSAYWQLESRCCFCGPFRPSEFAIFSPLPLHITICLETYGRGNLGHVRTQQESSSPLASREITANSNAYRLAATAVFRREITRDDLESFLGI